MLRNRGKSLGGAVHYLRPNRIRKKYVVHPKSIISLEFIVFTPVEKWNGNKVPICIEENALITENGIQWLHPPQEKVLIVR